jgi:PAS domain S-box-containing protein
MNQLLPQGPITETYGTVAENLPQLVVLTRRGGEITFVNRAWTEYTGLDLAHTTGATWRNLLHPADRDDAVRALEEAYRTSQPYSFECRVRSKDGQFRWHLAMGVPIESDPEQQEWLNTSLDIHSRKIGDVYRQLLSEVREVLASTLDADSMIEALMPLLSPLLADEVILTLYDPTEGPEREAVHSSSERGGRIYPYLMETRTGRSGVRLRERLETGGHLSARTPQEVSDRLQLQSASLDGMRLGALIALPLQARSRVIGKLLLLSFGNDTSVTDAELSLAQVLSEQVALSLDNARFFAEALRMSEELRHANQAKDEFLGLISHELRSPMAIIYGGVRLLEQKWHLLDDESKRELVGDISKQSHRLQAMLADLLYLSRLESGNKTAPEPVPPAVQVEDCLRRYRDINPGRKINVQIEEDLPSLAFNAAFFSHVLVNLISNADKYSDPGSEIDIKVGTENGEVAFRVLDRGIGVEPDEIERIFERFYRGEAAVNKAKGAGLGLTVCKRIVEAYHGHVWATLREGGGLEVGFALPAMTTESA